MVNPDLELFEVLIAAAEAKNLTEAAARLKISQPAVSVKLKALEAQTPLPVFHFEGRRKVLTHFGRELYRIAKANQVRIAESLEELSRKYASAEELRLRVAARKELVEVLSPRFRFAGRTEFHSMSSADSVQALLRHEVDVAIAYDSLLPNSAEVQARKVLESHSVFLVHRKFLKGKKIEFLARQKEFLTRTPCVIYEGGGHQLKDWVGEFGISFVELKVQAIAEDWRVVQTLIGNGWGYGIVPSHIPVASEEVISFAIPTAVLPKYTFYALFHKDLRAVPAFRELLGFRG